MSLLLTGRHICWSFALLSRAGPEAKLVRNLGARHLSSLSPGQAAAVLQISASCNEEELKKRFIVLAHQLHPDRPGGNAERFAAAREAFEVLRARIRAMGRAARSSSARSKAPSDSSNGTASDDFNFGALGLVGMVRSGRLEDAFDYWGALRSSSADIDHDTVIGLIELCQALPQRLGLASAASVLAELAREGRLVGGGSLTSGAALTHESHSERAKSARRTNDGSNATGTSQASSSNSADGSASWAEAAAAAGGAGDRHGVRRPDGLYTRGRARSAAKDKPAAPASTDSTPFDGPDSTRAQTDSSTEAAGAGSSSSGSGRAVSAPRRAGLWEGGDVEGGTRAAFDELLWHASEAEDMDLVLRIVDDMSDLGVKPSLALCEEKLFTFFPPAGRHA